jgi:hypothetical protein
MLCSPFMGSARQCVVSFRDREGVEHVAEITAESLFEAAALAQWDFRSGQCMRTARDLARLLTYHLRRSRDANGFASGHTEPD